LIFRIAIRSDAVPDALLDAIYASPVVVWPAVEPEDRDRFTDALAYEWPNVPPAARAARWGEADHKHHELRYLRLVWDSPDWIELLKGNYALD
jgi:hypothetical protein